MRLLLLLPLVYVTAVLQTALGDILRVGHVTPDLLGLLAVVWLLVTPGRRAFLVAGLIGLVADLISPGRLGLATGSLLLIGYALTQLRGKLGFDHFAWQLLAVWLATTALALSLAAGTWLLAEPSLPLTTLLARAFGVGAYTTGVGVPVLMILGWTREPSRKNGFLLAVQPAPDARR
jgi:rod shape-determining protein MreD